MKFFLGIYRFIYYSSKICILNFAKLVVFILLIFIFSCSSTLNMTTAGGLGKNIDEINYIYKIQNFNLLDLFSDISFAIKIKHFDKQSPIEAPTSYLINCFKLEVEDNQGKFIERENEFTDILIDITLSKYITRKFGKHYFKCFIDLEYLMIDNISSEKIITRSISISGKGSSSSEANLYAMQKVLSGILKNEEFLIFLKNIHQSNDNKISHFLNRVSKNLLTDFEKNYKISKSPKSIAFVGFKNDHDQLFTNIFSTALINFWKKNKYHFFTRLQLDEILKEYSISLSGIMDEKSILKELNLQMVELIIAGSIANIEDKYILEIQLLDTFTGKIIVSKSASISL